MDFSRAWKQLSPSKLRDRLSGVIPLSCLNQPSSCSLICGGTRISVLLRAADEAKVEITDEARSARVVGPGLRADEHDFVETATDFMIEEGRVATPLRGQTVSTDIGSVQTIIDDTLPSTPGVIDWAVKPAPRGLTDFARDPFYHPIASGSDEHLIEQLTTSPLQEVATFAELILLLQENKAANLERIAHLNSRGEVTRNVSRGDILYIAENLPQGRQDEACPTSQRKEDEGTSESWELSLRKFCVDDAKDKNCLAFSLERYHIIVALGDAVRGQMLKFHDAGAQADLEDLIATTKAESKKEADQETHCVTFNTSRSSSSIFDGCEAMSFEGRLGLLREEVSTDIKQIEEAISHRPRFVPRSLICLLCKIQTAFRNLCRLMRHSSAEQFQRMMPVLIDCAHVLQAARPILKEIQIAQTPQEYLEQNQRGLCVPCVISLHFTPHLMTTYVDFICQNCPKIDSGSSQTSRSL